jgi:predicted dehydrogenase
MKKLNVGVIGYGWAASAHIPALNALPQARVTAICSSRDLDATELSGKYGSPIAIYRRLDAMLADPDIHVVSITSYPQDHARQAIAAARAGKHLIIEKPLALSLHDLRAVQAAVKQGGVRVCVCFECRYSSQFLATKAVIDQGLLGKLHYGEVDYYHGIGPWYGQFRWNIKKGSGGSSLLSAGCHALDALLLCLGSDVVEVASYGAKSAHPQLKQYGYPSTSVTILKFRNGAVGKVASCIDCLQPYYFHTHLVGSEGSLLDNRFHSNKLAGLNKNQWSSLSMTLLDSGEVSDHPYQTQFAAFFEALEKDKAMPLTSLDDAVKTHEVIFAADQSATLGRPVKLSEFKK